MDRGRQHWTSSWLVLLFVPISTIHWAVITTLDPTNNHSSSKHKLDLLLEDNKVNIRTIDYIFKLNAKRDIYYSIGSIFNKIQPRQNVTALRRRMVAAQRALNRATKTLAAIPRIRQQRQRILQQPQKLVNVNCLQGYTYRLFLFYRETSLHETKPVLVVFVNGKFIFYLGLNRSKMCFAFRLGTGRKVSWSMVNVMGRKWHVICFQLTGRGGGRRMFV